VPSDTNTPIVFDVYTLVVLRRPDDAPEMSEEELDELQARHLAYRADLRWKGVLVANGPFDAQSDPSYRGMSIFACDLAEAARLSDADPSVVAGRLTYDVMEWWVPSDSFVFPLADRKVGDRRYLPGYVPEEVDDAGPFFHGTKADLKPGDLLGPGYRSNYGEGTTANFVYVTANRDGAGLAAELAGGDGPGRVYRVEPTGPIEDDPNVTNKRFPGNPTRSYRTRQPLRIVEEVLDWEGPSPETVQRMRDRMEVFKGLGIEAIND
jgi:rifampin ADP-ribosylating transferase